MAIYEFECSACGEHFEVSRAMSERDQLKREPPACPKCGTSGARELAPLINTKPPSS
jgi:putative FmdB family regulatory protein